MALIGYSVHVQGRLPCASINFQVLNDSVDVNVQFETQLVIKRETFQ